MKKERPNNPNAIRYFGMGVGLIGIFIMFVIDPPPDYVTLQCERTKGICVLEESGLFQFKTKYIKIKEIRDAHSEQFGFLMRGYRGPEIKLQDGNDISIGVGGLNLPFTSKEKETVVEINKFLSNTEVEHLSITQKGLPVIIPAGIFLLGGLFCIYKALKPYVIQGLSN